MSVEPVGFGRVRSLLHGPRHAQAWEALVESLEALAWEHPEQLQGVVLPYAQALLEREWPAALRRWPARWIEALDRGVASPPEWLTGLCVALTVYPRTVEGDSGLSRLTTTLACEALRHVRVLSLRGVRLSVGEVRALGQAPWLPGLESLDLSERPRDMLALAEWLRHVDQMPLTQLSLEAVGLQRLDLLVMMRGAWAGQLRELQIGRNALGPEGCARLFGWSQLKQLRALSLSGEVMDAASLHALAVSPWLEGLTRLELSSCRLGHGLDALASQQAFGQVQALDLSDNPLTRADLQAFSRGRWPALRRLALRGESASSPELLLDSPWWPQIERLDLSRSPMSSAWIEALQAHQAPGRLSQLRLASCHLDERHAVALVAWPPLSELRELTLSFNPLGPRGGARVWEAAQRGGLESLSLDRCMMRELPEPVSWRAEPLSWRRLSLSGNRLDEASLVRWAQGPWWGRLEALELRHCGLSARAVSALADSSALSSLQELRLGDNPLGDEGARALAQSPWLRGLRALDLSKAQLTDAALDALEASALMTCVRELDLSWNPAISPARERALRERLGLMASAR